MTPKPTTKKRGRPRKILGAVSVMERLSGLEAIPMYSQRECDAMVEKAVESRMRDFCNDLENVHLFVQEPVFKVFKITYEVPKKTLRKVSDYLMSKRGYQPISNTIL